MAAYHRLAYGVPPVDASDIEIARSRSGAHVGRLRQSPYREASAGHVVDAVRRMLAVPIFGDRACAVQAKMACARPLTP
jgi:hypothetical protein